VLSRLVPCIVPPLRDRLLLPPYIFVDILPHAFLSCAAVSFSLALPSRCSFVVRLTCILFCLYSLFGVGYTLLHASTKPPLIYNQGSEDEQTNDSNVVGAAARGTAQHHALTVDSHNLFLLHVSSTVYVP